MVNFDDWCHRAVAQIRFKPDKQMVFQELKAHLEDSYDHSGKLVDTYLKTVTK